MIFKPANVQLWKGLIGLMYHLGESYSVNKHLVTCVCHPRSIGTKAKILLPQIYLYVFSLREDFCACFIFTHHYVRAKNNSKCRLGAYRPSVCEIILLKQETQKDVDESSGTFVWCDTAAFRLFCEIYFKDLIPVTINILCLYSLQWLFLSCATDCRSNISSHWRDWFWSWSLLFTKIFTW